MQDVVTYRYAYVEGLTSLCPKHQTSDAAGAPLGAVSHGLHSGMCDACRRDKERRAFAEVMRTSRGCEHARTRTSDARGTTPTFDCDRRAQGGCTYRESCLGCGATREVASNGGFVDHGPWGQYDADQDRHEL